MQSARADLLTRAPAFVSVVLHSDMRDQAFFYGHSDDCVVPDRQER